MNNNPFEYWLAHDDPSYVNLMVAVEACLSSPGPCDRPVSELLTGEMFKELKVALNVDGMLDQKQVLRGGVPYAKGVGGSRSQSRSLFQVLMKENDILGVEEVEASMWPQLRQRLAVSGFMKDKSLGAKRLISMPDRVTNTIQVVTRKASEYKPPAACRPTVINNYLGDLSTMEVWWEAWKRRGAKGDTATWCRFMFVEPLAVRRKPSTRTTGS